MASDSEDDIRKRYRTRDAANDENGELTAEGAASKDYIQHLNELLERAEPLIYQVNSSVNNFVQGLEIRPPRERLTQLEQLMSTLMMMAKPTPAYRFRFQGVQGTYGTYKKKWDKALADVESGKIVRKIQPRKAG